MARTPGGFGTYGAGTNKGNAGSVALSGTPATTKPSTATGAAAKATSRVRGKGKNAKLKAVAAKKAKGAKPKKGAAKNPFVSEAADKAEDAREQSKK